MRLVYGLQSLVSSTELTGEADVRSSCARLGQVLGQVLGQGVLVALLTGAAWTPGGVALAEEGDPRLEAGKQTYYRYLGGWSPMA